MGTPAEGAGRREREGVGAGKEVQPGRVGGSQEAVGTAESTAKTAEGVMAQGEREAPGGADDRTFHVQPQEHDGPLFQKCASK